MLVIVIVEGCGVWYTSKQIQIDGIGIDVTFSFASTEFSTPQSVLHHLRNTQSMNDAIIATLASLHFAHISTQCAKGASH